MYNVTHNLKGFRNRYCGPAALSALTGITAEEASALLRKVGGRTSIKGTFHHEMVRALKALGLTIAERHPDNKPTVNQWAKRKPSGKLLVSITGHFITVEGRKLWDNSNHEGTELKKYGRRRVKKVWSITGRVNKQVVRDIAKTKKQTAKRTKSAKKQVYDLAKKHVMDVDWDGHSIEVSSPDGFHFPSECHYASAYRDDFDNEAEMWQGILNDIDGELEACHADCGGLE